MRQVENNLSNMPSGTSSNNLDADRVPPSMEGIATEGPASGWDTMGRRAVWVGSTKQARKLRYDSPGKDKEKAETIKHLLDGNREPEVRSGKKMGVVGIFACVMFLLLLLMLGNSTFQALAYRNHFNLGTKLLTAGEYDRAQVQFSLCISADPGDSDAYYYRGLAEAKRGSLGNALQDYDRALACNSKNFQALMAKASLHMKMHKYDEAVKDSTALINAKSGYLEAYRVRAAANDYLGHYDEAIADSTMFLKEYDSKDAHRADALAKRAFAFDQKKDYAAAQNDYTEALSAEPGLASLYAGRAIVFMHTRNWKAGLEDCKAALELKPNDAVLYKVEGICYAGLKDGRDSLAQLDKLVAAYPTIETHRMRGNERFTFHDYLGTLEDFDYVRGAIPNDKGINAKYQRAKLALAAQAPRTYTVKDEVKHAPMPSAADLNKPQSVLVHQGYKLMAAGDLEPAIEYLHAAVKALPSDATARRYLAHAFARSNMPADAVSQFSALSAIQTLLTADQLAYAHALADCNQLNQAKTVYYNILASNPSNDQARTSLIDMLLADGSSQAAAKLAMEGVAASPKQQGKYEKLFEQAVAAGTKSRTM